MKSKEFKKNSEALNNNSEKCVCFEKQFKNTANPEKIYSKNSTDQTAEYIRILEELMFIVSHKIRHSIANINGIIELQNKINLEQDSIDFVNLMKQETKLLDTYTQKMTCIIHKQRKKST